MRLGDRWWDFAGNEVGTVWKSSQQRAAHWYREAIPFPPQRKAEIEKRLKDLDEQPPGLEVLARQTKVFPDETHGFARSTNLLLEVNKNETTSPGAGYAGLELKGVRFLNVAVNASPNIERMARNSFAGFMVDYHAAPATPRESPSVSACSTRIRETITHIGEGHAVPDEYVDLGRHDLYELDLQQWAPPGWDGQLWFTLALQRAGLGTALTAQLMPLAKQQEKKPLELPVKPTWRTTGEYPLIAGVWSIVENKGTLVTIVQHGGDFVATASYKSGDETVSWRAEGTDQQERSHHHEPRPYPPPPARQVAAADPHCRPGSSRQVPRRLRRLRGRRSQVHVEAGGASERRGEGVAKMKRRMFLAVCLSVLPLSAAMAGEYKKFVFKIKTKGGSIVGNVVIEAKDMEDAKYKLRKRYPDCEIMEGHEKK